MGCLLMADSSLSIPLKGYVGGVGGLLRLLFTCLGIFSHAAPTASEIGSASGAGARDLFILPPLPCSNNNHPCKPPLTPAGRIPTPEAEIWERKRNATDRLTDKSGQKSGCPSAGGRGTMSPQDKRLKIRVSRKEGSVNVYSPFFLGRKRRRRERKEETKTTNSRSQSISSNM